MGTTATRRSETTEGVNYLDLAGEAVLAGLTCEQVIAQLIGRIRRDEGHLAYRRASGRHTRYDDQVTSDLRALALAICWLQEARESPRRDGVPGRPHAPADTTRITS